MVAIDFNGIDVSPLEQILFFVTIQLSDVVISSL